MREVSQYVSEPTLQVPVGMMVMYAGGTVPTGWLKCDGTGYATSTYPALFAAIGTTYGSSGGFQVPSFTDRSPVGAGGTATGALTGTDGAGVGITEAGLGRAIGSTGGHASVTLTSAQSGVPSHTHTYNDNYKLYYTALTSGATFVVPNNQTEVTRATTDATASNASSSHENRMPYLVLNFIIKAY
jgi:microcystin-dependent protein